MASATLSLLLIISFLSLSATSVPEEELSTALSALQSHLSYSLFANAVATSDLYYTLLDDKNSSFTLFAPINAGVYNLDMSAESAADYVSALRRHVVPRRLSLSTLHSAPSGSNLLTLEQHHAIHLQTRLYDDVILVDGIEVVAPGLFYSHSIAIHGLGGIINLPRHQSPPPPPPQISSDRIISKPPSADQDHPPQLPPIANTAPPPLPINSNHKISVPPIADPAPTLLPTASDHSISAPPIADPAPSPPPFTSDHSISVPPIADSAPSRPPIASDQSISVPPIANSETPSANSPGNADSPAAVKVSPASLTAPNLAPDYVATPLRSMECRERAENEMEMGHVIIGRGNAFTREEPPPLTCPYP